MSEPLIVIGNGMAAARFVEELSARALGRYAICVIGDEPRLAYNRVMLSALLADEVGFSDIELRPARWWRDRGVTLRYGARATQIDPVARTVLLEDGARLSYSRLVFATGSQPIKLAIPGIDLRGVLTFRDIDDVNNIAARSGTRVVVIGGGLLGLEAAYGLSKARAGASGAKVTVLHLMDRLMERQLDARAALLLKGAVEARGITVRLQAETVRVHGRERVEAVELRDGATIEADAVVVAVGIKSNIELARAAGLTVNRGIVVDDRLTTSNPDIHAIGECAEHRGLCYGLLEPAHEQARALAHRLAGENASYGGSLLTTNLKVSGIRVFSAGDFLGVTPGAQTIVLSDPGMGVYKKLVIADDRLLGAVLFGDTADGPWYLELMRSRSSIGRLRDHLMFGRELAARIAA
jgi:nitrite reductase (NADH) large subunit